MDMALAYFECVDMSPPNSTCQGMSLRQSKIAYLERIFLCDDDFRGGFGVAVGATKIFH